MLKKASLTLIVHQYLTSTIMWFKDRDYYSSRMWQGNVWETTLERPNLSGNQEADHLAKSSSSPTWKSLPQKPSSGQAVFEREMHAKHTVHHLMTRCITCHASNRPLSSGYTLEVCNLCSYQYCLGLSHTPQCLSRTAPQTQEHILQSCLLHREVRNQIWPHGALMQEKQWGSLEELTTTVQFILSINSTVWGFSIEHWGRWVS